MVRRGPIRRTDRETDKHLLYFPGYPSPAPGLRSLRSSGPPGHQGPSAPSSPHSAAPQPVQTPSKIPQKSTNIPLKSRTEAEIQPSSPGFNSSQLAVPAAGLCV